MDEATIALAVCSFSIAAIFLGLLIWGLRSGQFKDIEEPKYRMMEDEEPPSFAEEVGKGGKKDAAAK